MSSARSGPNPMTARYPSASPEATLRRSEQRVRAILEYAVDLVLVVDATVAVRYANAGVMRHLGHPPQRLIGRPLLDLVHPEDLDEVRAAFEMVIVEAVERRVETRLRHDDGAWCIFEVAIHSLLADPAVAGIVVAGRDVTEQRKTQAQLVQARRMETVGRLAGGIAHDFNNLVTVITAYATFLGDDLPEGDPHHEFVEEISRAAERAAGLTRQLLAFSRRQVLKPRPVDLNAIVTDVRRMLERVIGAHIALVTRLEPAVDAVFADPGQLEQALMNLVVNAGDAMPNGGTVTIATSNVELTEEFERNHLGAKAGQYVCLAVSDTGIGMDAQTQARVFEPFFTTKEPGKGTGLGLATVYGIVKQSQGSVWVESEVGKGTTFTIYLPRWSAPSTETPAADRRAEPGPAPRVLLVEDDPAIRSIARRVLVGRGMSVADTGDARAALEMLDTDADAVDILISDVVMPALDGLALATEARKRYPDLKILLVSGYSEANAGSSEPLPDAVSFLQKPFTPDSLLSAVEHLLVPTGAASS